MKFLSRKLLAISVLAFLILAGPGYALSAEPGVAEGISKAEALISRGQYAQAHEAFMDLLRAYPGDISVNVGVARSAKLAGKLTHARMAYARLAATLPDNAVIRLEYAHLLLAMGHSEEARQELAEAKRINPDISEGDMGKAVKAMEGHVRTVDYKLRLAGGVIYDSNMTTGPSLRGVEIGGLPITLDRSSTSRESMGTYLHAAGDVAWRAAADTPWWLVADISGYQRWYERTTPRRDLTFGRVAAGVRYLSGPVLAEVRLKTDMLLENNDKAVNLYGTEGTAIYALRADTHLLAKGGVEHREDIATRGRSGTYAYGGPYLRYFFGEARHSAMAGVKAYTSATNQRRYGYTGFEPTVSLFFNLPWETELVLSGSWHNEDYEGGASILDGQNRRDTQWRGSVFAIKNITENVRIEAGYQYTDNRSNSDLYNYEQHLVTLGMALNF